MSLFPTEFSEDHQMNAQQTLTPKQGQNAAVSGEITYRLATTQHELQQAFELVWSSYVRVGLEKKGARGLRVTKYHLLPNTKVFVAIAATGSHAGQVIGTISVVPDSTLGLPAAKVASAELVNLRRQGKRAAECVALSCNEEGTKQRVILKLFRLAFEYCQRSGYSTILAALTERHIGFYRRFLGFRPLGQLKPYEMGNGTPVQVHFIHLTAASRLIMGRAAALERDPDWRTFWRNEAAAVLSEAELARPWDSALIAHFIRRSGCFATQLDRPTIRALKTEYGRYGWHFAQ